MNLRAHNLPPPDGLIAADFVLDIGAGIRPTPWGNPSWHVCIEPHRPYAEQLRTAGLPVYDMTALRFLRLAPARIFDAVYMLDVIEHMTRGEGEEVIERVLELDAKQVVVFTPNGFMPQSHDAWGMGGEHWQTHRSGWLPQDFPGWKIQPYGDAFYAMYTR